MAKHSLIIVESPAKAKTIGKYLGKDFTVKACMGHLRDLPKSKLGVDLENDFEPVYKPIKGKEDIISDLKKAAKTADVVYLATDPDREGEAISWHLKQLLELSDEKCRRVTFNEITKKVVQESIREPRDIDQDLVDAQQARRILDRIVGYELSPLLWKKIRRGLSAGRVQSVATRMVDDRERENRGLPAGGVLDAGRASPGQRAGRRALCCPVSRQGRQKSGAEERRGSGCCDPRDGERRLRGEVRQAHRQAAQPLSALHHLHHAAGGFPEALHDAPPHHGHRPAAL